LKSATLTLKVNALAPFLILRILNPHNFLLEDIGLKKFDELKIRFMDYYDEDDKGELMTVIVLDFHPDKNPNIMVIECLEESAYWLSQKDYKIFSRKPIASILGALVPKLQIECGQFQTNNTYHLPNRRRFELLARMAKENGAVFFISRGKLVFKTKEDLFKQADIANYEYWNKSARYEIAQPRLIDHEFVNEEQKRNYIGWHIERGLIKSTVATGYPPKMHCCDTVGKLNNITKRLTPVVTFRSKGEGTMTIGSPIKLTWHSGIADRPIDESYPDRVLLGEVEHHEQKDFRTTITGVI